MRTYITVLTLALAGCGGGKNEAAAEDSGELAEDLEANLFFEQVHNYALGETAAIEFVAVAPETDLTIDWSAMTTDMHGEPMTPMDVEQVGLFEFALTQAEVETNVAEGALSQASTVSQWVYYNTSQGTSSQSSEYEILANPFDPAGLSVDPSRTWLASLFSFPGGTPTVRSTVFVVPTAGETNTTVWFTDASAQIEPLAELPALGLDVSASETQWVLSWEDITLDGGGSAFDPTLGDSLFVGKMAASDVSEVEDAFLQLSDEAEEFYRLDVSGVTVADLTQAESDAGDTFGGFTEDGIWFVGVECSTCTSPEPLLLSVVTVSP